MSKITSTITKGSDVSNTSSSFPEGSRKEFSPTPNSLQKFEITEEELKTNAGRLKLVKALQGFIYDGNIPWITGKWVDVAVRIREKPYLTYGGDFIPHMKNSNTGELIQAWSAISIGDGRLLREKTAEVFLDRHGSMLAVEKLSDGKMASVPLKDQDSEGIATLVEAARRYGVLKEQP